MNTNNTMIKQNLLKLKALNDCPGCDLSGVDTPEIRGKCQYEKNLALEARDFVRAKLANAKEIKLTNLQRGKYFRVVANVVVDGVSLERELLDNKLAYECDGGKKLSWCR